MARLKKQITSASLLSATWIQRVIQIVAIGLAMGFFAERSYAAYEEVVEQFLEESIENTSKSSKKLLKLCHTYAELRIYIGLFDCLERLRDSKNFDKSVYALEAGFLEIRAFIELGKIAAADALIESTVELANKEPYSSRDSRGIVADLLGLRATTLVQQNRSEQVPAVLTRIEELPCAREGIRCEERKVRATAMAYVSIGDYVSAGEALKSDPMERRARTAKFTGLALAAAAAAAGLNSATDAQALLDIASIGESLVLPQSWLADRAKHREFLSAKIALAKGDTLAARRALTNLYHGIDPLTGRTWSSSMYWATYKELGDAELARHQRLNNSTEERDALQKALLADHTLAEDVKALTLDVVVLKAKIELLREQHSAWSLRSRSKKSTRNAKVQHLKKDLKPLQRNRANLHEKLLTAKAGKENAENNADLDQIVLHQIRLDRYQRELIEVEKKAESYEQKIALFENPQQPEPDSDKKLRQFQLALRDKQRELKEKQKTLNALRRQYDESGQGVFSQLSELGAPPPPITNASDVSPLSGPWALDNAILFYGSAIDQLELQRSTIDTAVTKIGFSGDKQSVYAGMVRAQIANGDFGKAFEYVERGKARALVDLLADQRDFSRTPLESQFNADKFASFLKEDQQLLGLAAPPANQQDTEVAQLRGLEVQTESLSNIKLSLQQSAPELASLVSVSPVAMDEIQALIDDRETLVEFYYFGDELYAFALNRENIYVEQLEGAGLDDLVNDFRTAIVSDDALKWREASARLYDRLFAPLEDFIDTPRLLIVPHGSLHHVPFSALDSPSGQFVDRFTIRLLPSASVLKFLVRRVESRGSVLALGDPTLDLPHAAAEAQQVVARWDNSKLLLGADATETAVKEFGAGYRYLHIASHGKFRGDQPLGSSLLLAADAENDGHLTVEEIFQLRLEADLVTLSACETGVGQLLSGDDVVGLTRGFLYSGANAIISSLWKVPDESTALLMDHLYARINEGMPLSDALRASQLEARARYDSPLYWAAFQLTGNGMESSANQVIRLPGPSELSP